MPVEQQQAARFIGSHPSDPRWTHDTAARRAVGPSHRVALLARGVAGSGNGGGRPNSYQGALGERMGIEFVSVAPDRVEARMPVAGNTQPYGLLHGGASAVLAESTVRWRPR